jgi:DNA-binding transcriptional ArsR family regulator
MELAEVLSSKPRLKILKLLNTLGSLNVSDIARQIGANFTATSEHLKILESEGLLQVHTYGRVRMYRLKEGSVRAKAVANLLDVWEQK